MGLNVCMCACVCLCVCVSACTGSSRYMNEARIPIHKTSTNVNTKKNVLCVHACMCACVRARVHVRMHLDTAHT